METTLIEPALFAYTALFVVIAMVTDARTLRIPNWIVVAIALAYAVRAVLMPETTQPVYDVGIGVAIFATGWIFHDVFKWQFPFAPGDWKILAVVAMWLGPWLGFMCALYMGAIGGLMSLVFVLARRFPGLQAVLYRLMPGLTLPKAQLNTIPYGLAIGAATLMMMWQQVTTLGVV